MSTQTVFKGMAEHPAWIAARFVIFGIGGFIALFVGGLSLVIYTNSGRVELLRPGVAFLSLAAGGLMVLLGTGTLRRWAYVLVFLSPPIAMALWMITERYFPHWDERMPIGGKEFGILILSAPMVLSYAVVKRYYKRREAPKPSSTPTPQITKNEEGSR